MTSQKAGAGNGRRLAPTAVPDTSPRYSAFENGALQRRHSFGEIVGGQTLAEIREGLKTQKRHEAFLQYVEGIRSDGSNGTSRERA